MTDLPTPLRVLVLRNTYGWRVMLVTSNGITDATMGEPSKRRSLKRGGTLSLLLGVPVFYSNGLT